MVGLLELIGYLVPSANDCYLSHDIIDPANHAELREISREISLEHDYDIKTVSKHFHCAAFTKKEPGHVQTRVIASGKKVPVSTRYCQFKHRLVNQDRIEQGAEFYRQHEQSLLKASEAYGVDAHVITAIIGAESLYGKFLGRAKVRDALVDMALNTSNIAKRHYFRQELKTLVKLGINNKMEIHSLQGSFDGGIGIAQFMPSSYEKFAVSDKQTHPNLYDVEDAIVSIANYLKHHGYQSSEPIATSVTYQESAQYFDENNLTLHKTAMRPQYQFSMGNDEYEYWEAATNFRAIAAYNPRPHYVVSISQLAKAIHERINLQPK